ncbi:hypothetical protein LT493_27235 [Streptomyces tricolor]|nr:hypothetical protein [Streptomyces tricolor]
MNETPHTLSSARTLWGADRPPRRPHPRPAGPAPGGPGAHLRRPAHPLGTRRGRPVRHGRTPPARWSPGNCPPASRPSCCPARCARLGAVQSPVIPLPGP